MSRELSAEEIQKGRAIIDAHLTPEDLEQMKKLLDDETPTMLSPEQKQAIKSLFKTFGYF